jgi:hypothetical protein
VDRDPALITRRALLGLLALPVWIPELQAKKKSGHVVLLGDSIFDNAAYVGRGPDVLHQLQEALSPGWKVTLKAVDGATTADVIDQLFVSPHDTTHLVISTGGNDALLHKSLLEQNASSVAEVLHKLAVIRDKFQSDYRAMLDRVMALKRSTAICSIYEANYPDPDMRRIANTGLAVFNDVITREAAIRQIPLIDLRVIFSSTADYANPIEPSVIGGKKIASAVAALVQRI